MIDLDETIINHRYFKFLIIDYFHDGRILSINKDVVTAPVCNRAAVNNYFHYVPEIEIKEKRNDILIEILGYNYWDKDEKLRDTKKDLYIIRFKDCKYVSITDNQYFSYGEYGDYLDGIFKNSVIKDQIEKDHNERFYHLRIRTNQGYIDIIFKDIVIYNVPKDTEDIDISGMNNTSLHVIGSSTGLDKIKLSREIVYKGCQDSDCDRVWSDNLDIIGQEGILEDIAFLTDLYKKYISKIDYESLFIKAEIKDAIDKILTRAEI